MAPNAEDPIQAAVERWLRTVVSAPVAIPTAFVRATGRCVVRQVRAARELLTQPVRIATSLFELAGRAVPQASTPAVLDPPITTAVPSGDAPRRRAPASVDATALPIDEYESLAASQVVARLTSLTAGELDEVRRFEACHRGRRTVLGKIDQLLARA
jgi:hypothetical protein